MYSSSTIFYFVDAQYFCLGDCFTSPGKNYLLFLFGDLIVLTWCSLRFGSFSDTIGFTIFSRLKSNFLGLIATRI
jgi:hypothetical protein